MNQKVEYFESYSNLAYNAVGLLALYLHGDILFCLGMQALGIGSFVYHFDKSPNRRANPIWKFDWWAMAFLNTIVAGIHFDNLDVWSYLVLFHILYGYVLLGRFPVFIEVGLSSAISLVAIFLNRSTWTFILILLVFLIALAIRSKDEDPKQLKHHDSVWHSIWHFLTAGGYYLAVYLDI